MNYWLMKTEPETFGWADLVRDGKTTWDGVRNYAARNNLAAMKEGDLALIYHSVSEKAIVGIARVKREAFPDPTSEDTRWVAVEVEPKEALPRHVTLSEIKSEPRLADIQLVRLSRLSVVPLKPEEYNILLAMAQNS